MDRYIYILANTVNGKKYVGMSQCPDYRIRHHRADLRAGRHRVEMLQEEYNEYGEDAFASRVLDKFEEHEAARMEIFLMQVLRTKDPQYGYNYKDKTGTSPNAIRGRWRPPVRTWSRKCYASEFEEYLRCN